MQWKIWATSWTKFRNLSYSEVKIPGWKGVKGLWKCRACWPIEKQLFVKRQKKFSVESQKLWDLLFMGTSTLTSEHQPKLKLVSCLDTRLCSGPWVSFISGRRWGVCTGSVLYYNPNGIIPCASDEPLPSPKFSIPDLIILCGNYLPPRSA